MGILAVGIPSYKQQRKLVSAQVLFLSRMLKQCHARHALLLLPCSDGTCRTLMHLFVSRNVVGEDHGTGIANNAWCCGTIDSPRWLPRCMALGEEMTGGA